MKQSAATAPPQAWRRAAPSTCPADKQVGNPNPAGGSVPLASEIGRCVSAFAGR